MQLESRDVSVPDKFQEALATCFMSKYLHYTSTVFTKRLLRVSFAVYAN